MPVESVTGRMRELAERFLAALPGDLAILRDAARDRTGRAAAAGVAHRIAGRAGMFGFPALGIQASDLEDLIGDGDWPNDAFEAALEALNDLCAEAIRSGP